MKAIYAMALTFLLFPGCTRKAKDPADAQAIKNTMEEYIKAINSHDANAAVAMMTDKTFCAEPNSPAMTGRDAIRNRIQSILERFVSYDLEFKAPVSDVQVQGDLGTARGSWIMKATPKTGIEAPVNESGSWAVICRRQGDGSWKWDSAIVTSEQPVPGKTTNGEDEKTLIQIEQDLADTIVKADTTEQVQRRARVLGALNKAYKLSSLKVKELTPRVFGDVAIVNLVGEMQGTYNGKDTSGTLRGVDFFVRRDGRWQLAYSQNTVSIP